MHSGAQGECTPVLFWSKKKNRCASVQSVCPIRIVHSDARSKVRTCDWRSRGVPTPTELWNGIGTFHLSTPRARHPHQHVLPETGVHTGVHTGVQTGVHLVRLLVFVKSWNSRQKTRKLGRTRRDSLTQNIYICSNIFKMQETTTDLRRNMNGSK